MDSRLNARKSCSDGDFSNREIRRHKMDLTNLADSSYQVAYASNLTDLSNNRFA
jgi:hypothetical protein